MPRSGLARASGSGSSGEAVSTAAVRPGHAADCRDVPLRPKRRTASLPSPLDDLAPPFPVELPGLELLDDPADGHRQQWDQVQVGMDEADVAAVGDDGDGVAGEEHES